MQKDTYLADLLLLLQSTFSMANLWLLCALKDSTSVDHSTVQNVLMLKLAEVYSFIVVFVF